MVLDLRTVSTVLVITAFNTLKYFLRTTRRMFLTGRQAVTGREDE